jgi:small GTP-binding protein
MIKLKVVIGGSKGVGKTSLMRRAVDDRFDADTLSTIGVEFEVKTITVSDPSITTSPIPVQFSIWDFAGEEKFRQLFPAYCSGASAALLVFDVTEPKSFDDLENWLKLVRTAEPTISVCLVASKIDLSGQRKINKRQATRYKKKRNLELYTETSAKEGIGIHEIFDFLAKMLVQQSLQTCEFCGEKFSRHSKVCTNCGKTVKQ